MKKLFIFCFIILSSQLPIMSNEFSIYDGEYYEYNDFLRSFVHRKFSIGYDDDRKLFYFFTKNSSEHIWILMNKKQFIQFKNNLKKSINLETKVVNSIINVSITWGLEPLYFNSKLLKLNFDILNKSDIKYQLRIKTNKVYDIKYKHVSYKLNDVYLEKYQIESLLETISDTKIHKIITNN